MVRPRASDVAVLYVSEAYTPHDRRFLAAMADRLARTAWLPLRSVDDRWEKRPVPPGVVVLSPAARGSGGDDVDALAEAVRRAAKETVPDVVHAGPVPSGGLAAVRADAAPSVVMAWGSDVLLAESASEDGRTAVREALAGAAGFVGDAACVMDAAERLGLPRSTPRAIFPWGVEAAALVPRDGASPLRTRLGWNDAHVVLSARAWKPQYRIDVLLDAFELARRSDPRMRLALLGDGETSCDVRSRTRPLESAGIVACPGQVPADALRPWLEAADVYVSTVPSDGSSIALLEAMAAGLPSVVVDAFGNREWVEEGRTGWRVPAGDAQALAGALSRAFASDERRRELGKAAREVALARAQWDRNVEGLFALYDAIT